LHGVSPNTAVDAAKVELVARSPACHVVVRSWFSVPHPAAHRQTGSLVTGMRAHARRDRAETKAWAAICLCAVSTNWTSADRDGPNSGPSSVARPSPGVGQWRVQRGGKGEGGLPQTHNIKIFLNVFKTVSTGHNRDPYKTDEPIEMPSGLWSWVMGPRNHVLGGVQIP